MATLNGIDLGDIQSEKHRQYSDLDQQSFPLSDSSAAFVYDYAGVKRVINIDGIKTADTEAELWNWAAIIDALQTGNQPAYTFHSDRWSNSTTGSYTSGNFSVKVDSFEITAHNAQMHKIAYRIVLLEGE